MNFRPIALLGSFIPTILLWSQPVLDSSNYGPVPGLSYILYTGGQQLTPDAGSDVIWDYSNAIFANEGVLVLDCLPGIHAPNNSTVSEVNDSLIYTNFYRMDSTGYQLTGKWSEYYGVEATCYVPNMQMPFPFMMGSSSTSSFNCNGSEPVAGLPYSEDGYVQCTGIGSGTLILPSGSVDTVLLVERTEFGQHQTTDWHSPIQINFQYTLNQFLFTKPGIRAPLLSLFTYYDDYDTIYGSYLLDEGSVGVAEARVWTNGIELLPNPAKGMVEIRCSMKAGIILTAEILDMSGRVVLGGSRLTQADGIQRKVIDISSLNPGAYVVRLNDADGASMMKRLVIQ